MSGPDGFSQGSAGRGSAPQEPAPAANEIEGYESLPRIRKIAVGAWILFIPVAVFRRGLDGFLGLTCSAVVVMIAFLWLEGFAQRVLRPIPKASAGDSAFAILTRYALLGAAFAIIIDVARFDALSVLMGSSIVVVGILGEAVILAIRAALRD